MTKLPRAGEPLAKKQVMVTELGSVVVFAVIFFTSRVAVRMQACMHQFYFA